MGQLRILGDRTSKDLLSFERYLGPLTSLLASPEADTPFVIGIYGSWGSGKTTLLDLLEERLQQRYPEHFVIVRFNPWIHRGEKNLLIPLLHTLHDALAEDPAQRFIESARKIWTVLARLGADLALKAVTVKQVSVEDLEKLEQKYIQDKAKVTSEMRNLRKALQREADAIAGQNAKLVLMIDDLDRCEPSEIIDLLESIKLFLDLKHLFVLLAVDKEVIDRGIEVKYGKFRFAEQRQSAIGAEYLEKMVQLPLQLFPVPVQQVGTFIEDLGVSEALVDHLDLLKKILPSSPRKIKRILNILAVTCEIARGTRGLENLDIGILARLVVLQVQSGEFYAEAVRLPELLLAQEEVYAQRLTLANPTGFEKFGSTKSATLLELCTRFYNPNGFEARILEGVPFAAAREVLPTYFSMLGA